MFLNNYFLISESILNYFSIVNGSIFIHTSFVKWVPKLSKVINRSVNNLKCCYIY